MDRVQLLFDLTPTAEQEIDELMRDLQLASRADALNCALTLLQKFVKEMKSGNLIALVDEQNGRYRELLIPGLLASAPKDIA
jgi:hypothetical protein